MAYIGKEPIVGNFQKCDAITTSSTATYNLTVSSVAVSPETANNCIVSLNGVIQAPTSAYTISGSQIVFNSSLTSSDVVDFILILGSVLSVGTPTDRTVSLAKLATGTDGNLITYDASGNPAAVATGSDGEVLTSAGAGQPPAFEAAAAGGKVLQVVSTTKTDVHTASAAWSDITGLSVAITPAASSSKILVLVHANICNVTSVTNGCMVRLVRDSTSIAIGTGTLSSRIAASFEFNGNGASRTSTSGAIVHLDSPSTTSSTTYKLQGYTPSGTFGLNRISPDNDNAYTSRTASSITAIEIGA